MIYGHSVAALIPARGGSKGLPGKNVRLFAGRPLIAWTICTARDSGVVDRIVVSTDDDAIAEAALDAGASVVRRPQHLADDTALAADVMRYHLAAWGEGAEDIVAYLQPTSPLRVAQDIQGSLALLVERDHDSVAAFAPAETHPGTAWRLDDGRPHPWGESMMDWSRRQDHAPAYALNGALYAFWSRRFPSEGPHFLFGDQGAWIMPRERSIDIDDAVDFAMAEALLGLRVAD